MWDPSAPFVSVGQELHVCVATGLSYKAAAWSLPVRVIKYFWGGFTAFFKPHQKDLANLFFFFDENVMQIVIFNTEEVGS